MKNLPFHLFLALALSLLGGCASNDDDDPEDKVSRNFATESHTDSRRGRNCMDCHNSSHEYPFSLAGTVYQNAASGATDVRPNVKIELLAEDANQANIFNIVGSLEVDAHGNFYTTHSVNFSSGVHPCVTESNASCVDAQGNLLSNYVMSTTTTSGQCNQSGCHVADNRIYLPPSP